MAKLIDLDALNTFLQKLEERYIKKSGGTMSNTNVVTNLNADMLDGVHASRFLPYNLPYTDYDKRGWWVKIGTIILKGRYTSQSSLLSVCDNYTTVMNSPRYGLVYVKVQQQNALGESPNITLRCSGALSPSLLKGVLNITTTATTLDIYFKEDLNYQRGYLSCVSGADIRVSEQELVQDLPSGAQIDFALGDIAASVAWSGVTDKPTSLSGYGITDAYTKTEMNNTVARYLPLAGGTMSGKIASTFESGSWINGVSNAALTLNHKGYSAILSAPMANGRMCLSTYPAGGANVLYFGYATQAQIDAGTNGFNTKMEWDATYNRLTASYFKGTFEGKATTAGLADSATKLQTPRKLWNQSFDGSGDITGALVGVTAFQTSGTVLLCTDGGRVGIGENNPVSSCKLDVNGNVRIGESLEIANGRAYLFYNKGTDILHIQNEVGGIVNIDCDLMMDATLEVQGGISSHSYITAMAQNTTSDARLKDVTGQFLLKTEDIAKAPSVAFKWRKDGERAIGSIAQYWAEKAPLAVHDTKDGHLAMQYDVIALLASISNAKKLLSHEERIKTLEEENKRLRQLLNRL